MGQAISAEMGMKSKVCRQVVENLAGIATEQVKSMGKFTLPGLFRIKTRVKPATKAGKRMAFGKEVMVKAKPGRRWSRPSQWQRLRGTSEAASTFFLTGFRGHFTEQ